MAERMHRRIFAATAVAVVTAVGAACGGSGASTSARSTSTTNLGADSTTAGGSGSTAAPSAKHGAAAKKHATGATSATTQTTFAGHTVTVPFPGSSGTIANPGVTVPVVTPAGGPAPTVGATTPTTRHTTPTTVKPFDPSGTIDLSGTPGETLAQQHAAEQLIRATLKDLPRYSTEAAAYAAGFRSIGDAFTGDEHMVNWSYLNDNHVLDPMYPESLVYNTHGPTPTLEAAMFMLSLGQRFSDIPPLFSGPLTQWHVHNNLCFRDLGGNPDTQVVAGLTDGSGNCPAGLEKSVPVPMIHVWIVKNPCGPFAALLGIGAGQVPDGQTANCDTGHAGVL